MKIQRLFQTFPFESCFEVGFSFLEGLSHLSSSALTRTTLLGVQERAQMEVYGPPHSTLYLIISLYYTQTLSKYLLSPVCASRPLRKILFIFPSIVS